MIEEILPIELAEELKSDHPPVVLDVRETYELAYSSFPNAINIPVAELGGRLEELDPEADIAVLCRSGKRSLKAAQLLQEHGFKKVRNIATGINGWAETVDPTMAKY